MVKTNLFYVTGLFLYPQKTLLFCFQDFFREASGIKKVSKKLSDDVVDLDY